MFVVLAKIDYSVVNKARLNISYSGLHPILPSFYNSLIQIRLSRLTRFMAISSNKSLIHKSNPQVLLDFATTIKLATQCMK